MKPKIRIGIAVRAASHEQIKQANQKAWETEMKGMVSKATSSFWEHKFSDSITDAVKDVFGKIDDTGIYAIP